MRSYEDAGLGEEPDYKQMRGKLRAPEQIANAVIFLAAPEPDSINDGVAVSDNTYAAFE